MIKDGQYNFIDDANRFRIVFRPGSVSFVNLKEKEKIVWTYYTNQGSKLVSTKAVNSNDILLNYAFANNKTRIYQAKITVNFIELPRLTIKHIPRKETYV